MGSEALNLVLRPLDGFEETPKSLLVGGCVRNMLLGEAVSDIDIATLFTPEEVTKRLEGAGLKVVPTGIDHGTVTAVSDGQGYEITTLRKDVETDGRRAVVAYTQDWAEDAARRDFTLNTLLAAPDGRIFDPLGTGLTDLEARRIVFVGDAATRITEDVLRILRFFRFYAQYGQDEIDAAGLEACHAAADQIPALSRERITHEVLKILSVADPAPVLKIMFENGVLADLPDEDFSFDVFENYTGRDVLSRLFILGGMKSQSFEQYLILTNAQKSRLKTLDEAFQSLSDISEKNIKRLIYFYKNDIALEVYLLRCAVDRAAPDQAITELIKTWQAPVFPVTGEDLIAQGIPEGPELGAKLKEMERAWLEEQL